MRIASYEQLNHYVTVLARRCGTEPAKNDVISLSLIREWYLISDLLRHWSIFPSLCYIDRACYMVPFRLSRCYSQSGSKILIRQIRLPIEQEQGPRAALQSDWSHSLWKTPVFKARRNPVRFVFRKSLVSSANASTYPSFTAHLSQMASPSLVM